MGASFQSYCVRTGDPREVRGLLVQWLEMKGFDQLAEEPLLFGDAIREVVLFWSERWTVVLYSRYEELERLEFEFSKVAEPLLKVWVYDSDIWGYELSQKRELLAAFHSNPSYFGPREELPLPQNGDPELLCRVCDLPGLEARIRDLQRSKRLFAEDVAQRFCAAIGALPAVLQQDVIAELNPPSETAVAGGFRMERLFFRESHGDWKPAQLDLQALEVEQAEASEPAALPPEMAAQIRRWQLFGKVVGLLLRPVILVLGLLFRASFAWSQSQRSRPGPSRSRGSELQQLLDSLTGQPEPETGRSASTLTNRRFGARIELPAGVEGEAGSGQFVFRFTVNGATGWCTASGPEMLRALLRVPPDGALRRDEKLHIGGLPARVLEVERDTPHARLLTLTTIIQAEDAVFSFQLSTQSPAPPGLHQRFDELTQSFERLG